MTAAVDNWRTRLEEWAIPTELLESVDECPYTWPVELWQRRVQIARSEPETYTTRLVRRLASESVIDVGAGTGRSCLPLARAGLHVTAIEKSEEMARVLSSEFRDEGLDASVWIGTWPEVAEAIPEADVAMAAHVVYDVPDIAPFLAAMTRRARHAVVLELSSVHPWTDLGKYYQELHALERPLGPTAGDLVDVIVEEFGVVPRLFQWRREAQLWYRDIEELVDVYARRLVLPGERRQELRDLLIPDVKDRDGRFYLGDTDRSMVTVWWPV